VRATAYHGGMRGAERDAVQGRFMDGGIDVVCATTAFGMRGAGSRRGAVRDRRERGVLVPG